MIIILILVEKSYLLEYLLIAIGWIKNTSIYDIPYFVTDNSEAKNLYKWSPKKNIDDIIFDTFLWMKLNFKKIKLYFR